MKIKDLTLPDLPYDYNALEPAISQTVMNLHHTKHHNGYLTKLQQGVEGSKYQDMDLVEAFKNLNSVEESYKKAIQNNGGGFYNHSLFWNIMTPNYSDPSSSLNQKLSDSFGSFNDFKDKFKQASLSVFGSGWAWLVVNNGNLQIVTTPNQDNPLMNHINLGLPVLGLDVWEHAYYIDYKSDRGSYIDNWFSVVNWSQVEKNING